jgi:hypothetical protein
MSEEVTIDADASPELVAEAEAFQAELNAEAPPEVDAPLEQEGAANEETPAEEPKVEEAVNEPLVFKVKGEEKEFSREQLNNMLNRETTFQKKNDEMRRSEEYKMGLLFAEAKSGNVAAQKKVKDILGELTNIDELDDVKEDYDVDLKHDEALKAFDAEEPFADVKDEVDFQETLDKIKDNFGEKIPSVVFKDYWEDPASRRVLYDLERSGRGPELLTAFDEELKGMSSLDRAKVNSDSTLWGNLFAEVVKSQNAKQAATEPKIEENTSLDAVSPGDGSHSVQTGVSEPDIESMTSAEFEEYSRKLLANAPRQG